MTIDFVKMLYEGGCVKRFHTVRTIGEQNVAEHSFYVAALAAHLYPEASANLLRACLYHDLAEQNTGDVPAHVKWANPSMKKAVAEEELAFERFWEINFELTEKEISVIKWCDILEALLYSEKQLELGNTNLRIVIQRLLRYIRVNSMKPFNERAEKLFRTIVSRLKEKYGAIC